MIYLKEQKGNRIFKMFHFRDLSKINQKRVIDEELTWELEVMDEWSPYHNAYERSITNSGDFDYNFFKKIIYKEHINDIIFQIEDKDEIYDNEAMSIASYRSLNDEIIYDYYYKGKEIECIEISEDEYKKQLRILRIKRILE
jgi:hypothetical protein